MEESTRVQFSSTLAGPAFGSAFGEIILTSVGTRTETTVDVLVNPGVTEDRPEVVQSPVGHVAGFGLMSGVKGQTKHLSFDISSAPVHNVTFNNHEYEIRLLRIQPVADQLTNAFQYEFMVTKRTPST
jgi:hypothetical protein